MKVGLCVASKIDDVDYIFRIHLESFTLHVENSPNLLQGMAHGMVSGFAVKGERQENEKEDATEEE